MNSILELKKIINALDNTKSAIDLKTFDSVFSDIWKLYKDRTPFNTLLKMIRSLTQYLISKKTAAHMDARPLLDSVTDQLEILMNTPSLEKNIIEKMVSEQLHEYKLFQNKIISNPDINIEDLDELKAVILAIDWEISDETLLNFDTVVTQLLQTFKPYKIHYIFLKMIHSTGRYIGIKKVNAPTDSIAFLRRIFEDLSQIIQKKEMSFNEKKKMLEEDLIKFNDFKQRISKSSKQSKTNPRESKRDNDSVMPALSHVKPSKTNTKQEQMSLTCLPDQQNAQSDFKDSDSEFEPALVNKQTGYSAPRDVMDDLFSVKESPADELLDAIHLMEVQGKGASGENAMQMFSQEDESQSGSVKKFITQRKDTTPIAEINNRLDEFFNLENCETTSSETPNGFFPEDNANSKNTDGIESLNNEDIIVPFADEDEMYEDLDSKSDGPEFLNDPSGEETLKRLEFSINEENWITDKACLDLIHQDIVFLKTVWEKDFQKIRLLEIISYNMNRLLTKNSADQLSEKSFSAEFNSDFDSIQNKPSGFWRKLKSIFTS